MTEPISTEPAAEASASMSEAPRAKPKGWSQRRKRARTSLLAAGEPAVWLTGGTLVICSAMVAGLLGLVLAKGLSTFWPQPVERFSTPDGRVYMGEVTREDTYRPTPAVIGRLPEPTQASAKAFLEESGGDADRFLVRTGNFRLTQNHFSWVGDFEIAERDEPDWALVLERLEWGRFYGFPRAMAIFQAPEASGAAAAAVQGGSEMPAPPSGYAAIAELAEGPQAAWAAFREHHGEVRERWQQRRSLEEDDTGAVNRVQEKARLRVREAELELEQETEGSAGWTQAQEHLAKAREDFEEARTWANEEFSRIRAEIDAIQLENGRYQFLMETAGEGTSAPQSTWVRLDEIVRAYPANRLSGLQKTGIYASRWKEFLTEDPREANSEGGVFPAIFGTVAMTLIMALAVAPFGVLAALYLREYAKAGPVVSAVRIAVNNLAGVPSIVFGVFGLGFFCYVVGASVDQLLFAAELPNPTFGKGGLLWASLTLALLTLPVVIVATEEAVAAVPGSMREGSYACGASKWQTIQRIVLPRALPGIITGMVLAIARGAGEVAPLMLVGAVKLAPKLPIDGVFPYLHPERSFMHLGFHIYDVGFQSQNSEAAKPMVFTTTLLLIAIIALLNLATIWLRSRLRKRFAAGKF